MAIVILLAGTVRFQSRRKRLVRLVLMSGLSIARLSQDCDQSYSLEPATRRSYIDPAGS
jgi:hypothetical protein